MGWIADEREPFATAQHKEDKIQGGEVSRKAQEQETGGTYQVLSDRSRQQHLFKDAMKGVVPTQGQGRAGHLFWSVRVCCLAVRCLICSRMPKGWQQETRG